MDSCSQKRKGKVENDKTEYLWYSPEWDLFDIATRDSGFVFKDEHGEFHSCFPYHDIP
jgi:hypothetical protein